MSLTEIIFEAISPAVEASGYFLEEVQILSPGNRRVITCIVDGKNNLNMDEVTALSREIAGVLDEAPFMGETPFTLEVSSPGVDRPLTHPRHWVKNQDRLVRVILQSGEVVAGRIISVSDEGAQLLTGEKSAAEVGVLFTDIKKALIEIEFNRKGAEL